MTDRLEQLTKQIYEEGVVKARDEASSIINSAQEEKKRILRQARQEAEDIVAVAKKEAADIKKRSESEVRMASQQALALLRQKIIELICVKVASSSSKGLVDDPQFLKKLIDAVMKTWLSTGCQDKELYLKLPASMQEDIQEYLLEKGKQKLDEEISIEFDEKIKSGFIISPKDGSYRIGFTEDDFNSLIQYFLRPRLKKFLFGEEQK